jgi:hypothetical protein
MRAIKEIYEIKHKVFERGYELLRKYNVKGSNDRQVPVIPFLLASLSIA